MNIQTLQTQTFDGYTVELTFYNEKDRVFKYYIKAYDHKNRKVKQVKCTNQASAQAEYNNLFKAFTGKDKKQIKNLLNRT